MQIKLVDGKTGRPIQSSWLSPRISVYVGLGRESDLSLLLTTNVQGIVSLRFPSNASEINVPDCQGKHAAWNNLLNNLNKKDEEQFDNRYKNCTNLIVKDPAIGLVDVISVGPLMSQGIRYIPCWSGDAFSLFSTEEVLQHGIITANSCGKTTGSPQPGQLILVVRKPTLREQWNQLN